MTETAQEGFVLILHEVEDYPRWKAIFDAAATIRHAAGEVEYHLLAAETDARQVVHFSRWRSLAAARAFFESAELVDIRKRAGVKAPDFHYLREVEKGVLDQS